MPVMPYHDRGEDVRPLAPDENRAMAAVECEANIRDGIVPGHDQSALPPECDDRDEVGLFEAANIHDRRAPGLVGQAGPVSTGVSGCPPHSVQEPS